jgi:Telomeric single stranded DNA binding POT1/CDC13
VPSTPVRFHDGFDTPNLSQERWETPAFLRTKRLISPSPLQSDFNLFAEEDGYIPGKGRKRPRFSFPSSEWRLVNEPDSLAEDLHENDGDWFESDEEKLDHDDEEDEAVTGAAHEADTSVETMSHTILVEDAPTGDAQLVESGTQISSVNITDKDVQSFQIITSSPEEAVVQPSLQKTSLSSETPRLNPLTSPDLPAPSPLVSTPAEHFGHQYSLHTNPTHPDFFGHNAHPHVALDSYNAEPRDSVEVHSTDAQFQNAGILDINSNLRSEYPEQNIPTATSRPESSRQSSPLAAASKPPVLLTEQAIATTTDTANPLEQPDYHGTNTETFLGEDVEMAKSEPGERRHIHEIAIDAERLRDMQEIKEDEDDGFEKSSEYFTNHPNLMMEKGSDHNSRYSESEEMIYEEVPVNLERAEDGDLRHTVNQNIEEDESELEDTDLSDDAEEDLEEVISVEPETDVGSEFESENEFYEEPISKPEIPQRTVHPEVIVIDSDSEDEPSQPNTRPAIQERVVSHETDPSNVYQYDDYMQEERDEFSDAEDQNEQHDADAIQSDADPYDYEHPSHEDLPVPDAYIMNEETLSSNSIQQAEDDDNSPSREESPIEPTNVTSLGQLPEAGIDEDVTHLDTVRTSLTADALSGRFTADKEPRVLEEQGQDGSRGSEEASAKGDENDALAKKDQSQALEGQTFGHHHYSSSVRNIQRLVYRTASPKPSPQSAPTPPLTLDDEPLHKTAGPKADVPANPGSPASVSDVVELESLDDTRRHRWTDGLDETPQKPDSRSSDEEFATPTPGTAGENDGVLEKLDEVVLVKDHSTQPSPGARRQPFHSERRDLQAVIPVPDTPVDDVKVYPTLATLVGWLNQTIGIISVVVDISPAEPVTSTSEEYCTRLRITDISMAGTTIVVDIAQPHEESLLAVTEGDVIMLQNFEVHSLNGSLKLLSADGSDWVIFRNITDEPRATNPMITFREHEDAYVKTLQNWYREDGAAMAADHMLQLSISQEDINPSPFTVASSDAGSLDSRTSGSVSRRRARRKKSHHRITIHELRDGRRYTDVGPPGSDLIHELRDGTVYAHSFGDS